MATPSTSTLRQRRAVAQTVLPAATRRDAPRLRVLVVATFLITGAAHFAMPDRLAAIVPPWLPRPVLLVYLSGAAELAGALGLCQRSTRAWAGWGLMSLLVAVFPANVQMLANARQSAAPGWWQVALTLRLALQPILIWLVWRAAALGAGKR